MTMIRILDVARDNKLGTLAMLLASAFVLLGLPDQILTIWRAKSVESISIGMFLLLVAQAVAWVCYGTVKKDWAIIIPNVFATLLGTVIVVEWFVLR